MNQEMFTDLITKEKGISDSEYKQLIGGHLHDHIRSALKHIPLRHKKHKEEHMTEHVLHGGARSGGKLKKHHKLDSICM